MHGGTVWLINEASTVNTR